MKYTPISSSIDNTIMPGEVFYYISFNDELCEFYINRATWANHITDNSRNVKGNIFKSKDDAKHVADELNKMALSIFKFGEMR